MSSLTNENDSHFHGKAVHNASSFYRHGLNGLNGLENPLNPFNPWLKELPVFHDFEDLAGILDIGERIGVEDNKIGQLPFLKCADFGFPAHNARRIPGSSDNNVHGTESGYQECGGRY